MRAPGTGPSGLQVFALTALTMIAFAANSVLGRMGLLGGDIGAGSFALIRLISGAVVLALIAGPMRTVKSGTWRGGLALLVYAAFFSYAYLQLDAGTGALLLFAMVQATMVGAGLVGGERFTALQWIGIVTAFGALVWLVSPGLDAPPLMAAGAMMIAGVGWGIYSLIGRTAGATPTLNTAGNFWRASLLALVLLGPILLYIHPEQRPGTNGIIIAAVSGAITSGLGYALWYYTLKSLTAMRAGVSQLTVPAIAAFGGILFLGEDPTLRFVLSSALILAGVGLATLTPGKERKTVDTD